jgi:folylpolyglutamate synthase/dihydropteroate synthase
MSISKGKMAAEILNIANNFSCKLVLLDGSSYKLMKSEELLKITSANIQQTGNIEEILPLLAKEDFDKILLVTGTFFIMSQAYQILLNI